MENGTYTVHNAFDDNDDVISCLSTRISSSLVIAIRSDPDAWLALFQALSVTNYTDDHPYTAGVEVGVNDVDVGVGARLTAQRPLFVTSTTSSTTQMAQCDDLASPLIDKQPDNASVHSLTIANPNPKSGRMRNMHPCKECQDNRVKVCLTSLLSHFPSSPYFFLVPLSPPRLYLLHILHNSDPCPNASLYFQCEYIDSPHATDPKRICKRCAERDVPCVSSQKKNRKKVNPMPDHPIPHPLSSHSGSII